MIKVQLLHDAVVTARKGSILIISEGQYKSLGDKAVIVDETEKTEEPETALQETLEEPEETKPKAKKTTKKK